MLLCCAAVVVVLLCSTSIVADLGRSHIGSDGDVHANHTTEARKESPTEEVDHHDPVVDVRGGVVAVRRVNRLPTQFKSVHVVEVVESFVGATVAAVPLGQHAYVCVCVSCLCGDVCCCPTAEDNVCWCVV